MIAVLQRVSQAQVLIAGQRVAEIGPGLQVHLINDGPVTIALRMLPGT